MATGFTNHPRKPKSPHLVAKFATRTVPVTSVTHHDAGWLESPLGDIFFMDPHDITRYFGI